MEQVQHYKNTFSLEKDRSNVKRSEKLICLKQQVNKRSEQILNAQKEIEQVRVILTDARKKIELMKAKDATKWLGTSVANKPL